jgi:hypothetical protein
MLLMCAFQVRSLLMVTPRYLLSSTYINDLPENLHSSAKLFADDCLLYREVNTTSDTNKLQEDLDIMSSIRSLLWGSQHVDAYSNVGLTIVVKVCCFTFWVHPWIFRFIKPSVFVIRAGTKRKTIKQDYTIHNHILEVTISKDLTWKAHINNIINKANKTLGFIKRNIHGLYSYNYCTQNALLFFALVLCPQSDLCYEDPSMWMHIPMWVFCHKSWYKTQDHQTRLYHPHWITY